MTVVVKKERRMNMRIFGIDREDGSISETSPEEQDAIFKMMGRREYWELAEFPDDVTDADLYEHFGVEGFRVYRRREPLKA